jgi:hypothetical protein
MYKIGLLLAPKAQEYLSAMKEEYKMDAWVWAVVAVVVIIVVAGCAYYYLQTKKKKSA